MKKKFISPFNDDTFEKEFTEHDISKYDVLYHVTTKDRIENIKNYGLKIDQPQYKSLIETGMLFFSYPMKHTTDDLFRYYDSSYIVALDVEKLIKDNIIFYDDNFSNQDQSSNRNHLCCEVDIPVKYIKKIIEPFE